MVEEGHVACVTKRKIKKETKMRQRKAYKDKGGAASLLHGLNKSVFSAERF